MTIPEILPFPPCAVRNGESESVMVKAAIRNGFIRLYSSAACLDWKANQRNHVCYPYNGKERAFRPALCFSNSNSSLLDAREFLEHSPILKTVLLS
jgi:hypothetical protein